MTLGAEPKKVALLGVLVVVAVAGVYFNSASDTPAPVPSRRAPAITTATSPLAPAAKQNTRVSRQSNSEFRPRVMGSRPDDKVDVNNIDPELRLDLLAKVHEVAPIAAGRNLFQFGKPPAPPTPVPTNVPKIPVNQAAVTPPPQPVGPVGPPPPPPPPPINLKYYGSITSKTDGRKQGFLIDGDEILMVSENQTVKQRYRIVKISQTTIDIEDVPAKNTQTLRMPPDAPPPA